MAQKDKSSYHLKQRRGLVPTRYDKNSASFHRGAYKNPEPAFVPRVSKGQVFVDKHKLHPCARQVGQVPDGTKPLLFECYPSNLKD